MNRLCAPHTLDPLLAGPIMLTASEFDDPVVFVHDALLDPRATATNLRKLADEVPSGSPTLSFELGTSRHAPSTAPRR